MRQLKIQKSITNRSSEALDKYLVEIGRAPLISIDEEIELAQKIRKGGIEGERAKDKLVTANLRFVVSVAKQYQHQGLTLTDLIDEGNIGLIKAAQKFDETRGFKFISYAVWWIRQSILQAIAEQSRIVRLPLNQVGSLNKINHEINKFEQENQRHPSVSELSAATNLDKDKLVTANLRFVVSVAKQYQHQGLTLTDLIDEGNIGLIKAAQKFDETRGFKFISYAVWWIRQSILQAIAEQSRIVRLPLNQVGSLNKINHEINKFEQENQRHPSVSELSAATNLDEDKIGQSLMADGHHVSIDAPFQDGEDNCMLDVMASGEDSRTDRHVDHESMAQELNSVLNKVLKDREITIIRECFGIGCHEKGLEEIGDQLGLTRERVRQIREKSIAKLRDSGNAKILMKYLG